MLRGLRFLPFFALRHVLFPLVAVGALVAGIAYVTSKYDDTVLPKTK
ncbi:MAG: hypothetical protein WCP29_06215 [Acidobacteriota bacterium]